MPGIGSSRAITSLGTILVGTCLFYAGCASQRPFAVPEGDSNWPEAVRQESAVRAAQGGDGAVEQALQGSPVWRAGFANRPGVVTAPRELEKVSHPTYVVETPDVLLVDAVRLVPLPPYKVEPLDTLAIKVTGTLPNEPIDGIVAVDPSGMVDLGFTYGSVKLLGLTLKEATKTIDGHLKAKLKPPYEVNVFLVETKVPQQVRGPHLIRQDGTIGLGSYGSVYVNGMTIAQAKSAIETHLSQFLFEPKVSVEVAGFNSHVYFIIFDFPGASGQLLHRRPITGNETVLDALSDFTVKGLPPGVSKRRIWVARPTPARTGQTEILPVDWDAITRNGSTATNYQLLPGDRVYVGQDPCQAVEITLNRIFAPVERIFGIVLFGNSVVNNLSNPNGSGGNGGFGTR